MGVTRKIGRKINNLTGATDRARAKERRQVRGMQYAEHDREDRQAHEVEMWKRNEDSRRASSPRTQRRSSSRG